MIRTINCLLVVGLLFHGLASSAMEDKGRSLIVSTMNIEWYGLNKTRDGGVTPAKRDRALKHFLSRTLSDSDVIVFQEIVNVQRFYEEVIPYEYDCMTYRHQGGQHQHVVLCYKDKYLKFVRHHSDNNYKIEEVASSSKARPALHGTIVDRRSGDHLLNIIAVHLKAFPEETAKRLKQVRVIGSHVSRYQERTPYIVLGDFNSHERKLTHKNRDDKYLMDSIFRGRNANLKLINNRYRTYRKRDQANQLDQIWVSQWAETSDGVRVIGPCNGGASQSELAKYNAYISDHCPVSVKVSVGK